MSRDLPPHPHLDHLKKQAKALLRRLRQQRPDATLSDAQQALAREYGFASWPRMKAHVAALPPPSPLFERLTEATRRALFFSRYEASSLGQVQLTPEHLLLGVIRGAAGLSQQLFAHAAVGVDEARAALTTANPAREVPTAGLEIPFQTGTKALFRVAAEEADRLGHDEIATVHLLLAIIRRSADAATFLRGRGITLDGAREAAAGAPRADLQ